MGLYSGGKKEVYRPVGDQVDRQSQSARLRYHQTEKSLPTIGETEPDELKKYSQQYQDARFAQDHPVRNVVAKGLHSIAMTPTVMKDVLMGDFSVLSPDEFAKRRNNLSAKQIVTDGAEVMALDMGGEMAVAAGVKVASKAKGLFNTKGFEVADEIKNVSLTGGSSPSKVNKGFLDDASKNFKSEIDWAKWNKEIPDNTQLMKEYNAIEQTTKANGTWMKNSDGSTFQGTPEQFVQQNSENFKKAFPNVVKDEAGNVQYNYHGSPNKFEIFDKNKFNKGEFGKGIYTTTNKDIVLKGYAKPRGVKSENVELGKDGHLYELYLNAKNPKVFNTMDDFLEHTNYQDITDFGKTMDDYLTLPELKEKYKETLKNYSFKNDEELESFIANAFGRKNQMKSRAQLVMPDVDFVRFNDIDLKPQVTPFHASYPKSAIGNNGMFDMTNPDIYKVIAPVGLAGTGLYNLKK